MRFVRLLLYYCLGLFIGGFSVVAFSSSPQWSAWSPQEPSAHCAQQFVASGAGNNGWVHHSINYTYTGTGEQASCRAQCVDAQKCGAQLGVIGSYGTPATRSASCIPPETYADGQCNAPCVAGSGAGYYSTGFGTTACIGGCSYTRSASGNFSTCSGWSDATGWSSCYLAQSGATCSTPNGAPSSAQAQCPVGQCPGTINGVPVCVPCTGKTDTQSSGTKTTTNPDGSTTTTTTTINSTSYGGSTTTTTTTNITNTPAGGGTPTTTTTTDTETKPKDSFCIENPDSPLCKQSSFGGSCGSFSCDGDAIQCAMAKEQHKRNCVLFETETEQSTLGRDAAAGNDPFKSQFPTAEGQKQTIDLSSKLDQSGFLSGSCPAPLQTSFMGHQITLDWSNACMVVEWLGYLVVASAMVLAYLIIGG